MGSLKEIKVHNEWSEPAIFTMVSSSKSPALKRIIFLNFFFPLTTRPIEAKFHVGPPWDGGMKVCSTGLGHMTKTTAMLI